MYTTQLPKLGTAQQFLFSYTKSLLALARRDLEFAQSFRAAIISQNWTSVPDTSNVPDSMYIYPESQADAVTIARWVIHSLQRHPEYMAVRGALSHWAQNYESPKDLVLGIVGLAIIGPTLGIISSKKKKKRKSQLIIEETYFRSLSKTKLATLSTQLTQTVIARETQLAGGNVYNLHPDSAAWCIEEAVTAIYTDSAENIALLLKTVATENLSHATEKNAAGKIQAIVIAPSVNDSLVDESDAQSV
jgi:hypothetical protein